MCDQCGDANTTHERHSAPKWDADQFNQAFDRVVGKDVRYRTVIDLVSTQNAA